MKTTVVVAVPGAADVVVNRTRMAVQVLNPTDWVTLGKTLNFSTLVSSPIIWVVRIK